MTLPRVAVLLLAALPLAALAVPASDWVDVRDHGAAGDGRLDDTKAIRKALAAAKARKGVLYFPTGIYKVTETLRVTDGESHGCRIEGANPEGVLILSFLRGSDPVFLFRGGSGKMSNVGIRNLSLAADSSRDLEGTAVRLDGQCFAQFENLRIRRFRNGLWLHNQSQGAFTETNVFQRVNIDFCANGVRMEHGAGHESFHGNIFDGLYLNVGAGQIGFNHLSGYYYNGRFRLLFWSHSDSAVLINAGGNAEHNIGDITFEGGDRRTSPFGASRITGRGRFWFNGFLRGIGPFKDETARRGADSCQQVFACDNWWAPRPYGGTGLMAGPPAGPTTTYNGPFGYFQSLRAPNIESVLLNTPEDGKSSNGLYLGTTSHRCPEPQGRVGMFLSSDGRLLQSTAKGGLRLEAASLSVPGGGLSVGAVKAPGEALEVEGNIRASGSMVAAGGHWSPEDSVSAAGVTEVTGVLEKAMRLKAVRYAVAGSGTRRVGMGALDLERAFPELVSTGKDGRKAVDYARMAPFLLEALKEQQAQILAQQRRIDRLDSALKASLSARER